MTRSFYCHQCSVNVEINLEQWACRRCGSGFVEELPPRTYPTRPRNGHSETFRRNPATNRTPASQAPRNIREVEVLQQMLTPQLQQQNQQNQNRYKNVYLLIWNSKMKRNTEAANNSNSQWPREQSKANPLETFVVCLRRRKPPPRETAWRNARGVSWGVPGRCRNSRIARHNYK